jgi:prolyl oligopeptidase
MKQCLILMLLAKGKENGSTGTSFLYPEFDLCMLNLSRGGSDAIEIREFDLKKKPLLMVDFMSEQRRVSWVNRNIVSTIWKTTTTSRVSPYKILNRGTSLSEAKHFSR